MKLDISEIASHLGKRIHTDIDEPPIVDADSGVKCVKPITGEITFSNTGKHILARGHFETTVEIECSRCLGPYLVELSLPIEEDLQIPGHTIEALEEAELPEDEKEPLFVDYVLDLTELLRQNISVAVPIKTLCSEECKGLCPRCGKDLNEGPCGCLPDAEESAFAALASLLEEEPEG
ncbi:MAG: YceD family protein [Armatimonadota bacterium]